MDDVTILTDYIDTVDKLIKYLQRFPPDMEVDVKYDSGYGDGAFTKNAIYVKDGKLVIELS